MTARNRAIYGCAGTELTETERAFLHDAKPWGFILFARNIANREQVRRLVLTLRETVGDGCAPVLIDQEDGGVLPVMKHAPGHGRANADSHVALPRVSVPADELSTTDFVPFRRLRDCPLAMTAHVVYEALDPQRPATTSPKVINRVIRGEIGFQGVLLSDDLSMDALSGSL